MAKHIVVIPGDGIGEEITAGAVKVLQKIDEVCHIGLTFEKKPAGGTAYDLCGSPLPEDTIEAAKKADAILFGAVGGDKWDNVDPKLRPEQAVLGLRKALGSTSTCARSKYRKSWLNIRRSNRISSPVRTSSSSANSSAASTSATAVNRKSTTASNARGTWKITVFLRYSASAHLP